jgi:hypothetical protein
VKRARFEAAELHTMSCQQHAVNALAGFLVSGDPAHRRRACDHMRQAIQAMEVAYSTALETGMPEASTWYFRNVNSWLRKELSAKLANYGGDASTANTRREQE